jgi:alpha-beta hydrolase superfamily lysophospholipase
MNLSFDDLASDALAAVERLKSHPDIDARHIGIWGMSQGGWIAPLAASRSPDIAFVIVVSAPAVTPEVQELTRTRYEMLADGESAADIDLALRLYRAMNHWTRTGDGWDEYVALRQQAVGKRWGPPAGPPRQDNPYYQFWRKIIDYDPLPTLAKVRRPMFAAYGGLDQNVRAADNAAVMDSALRAAGSPDSRVIVYPRGNHILMEARTGTPREAAALQRFVPGYFDTLTAWVLARVGRRP